MHAASRRRRNTIGSVVGEWGCGAPAAVIAVGGPSKRGEAPRPQGWIFKVQLHKSRLRDGEAATRNRGQDEGGERFHEVFLGAQLVRFPHILFPARSG